MIIFLGISGSGKTTQSKELAKRLRCARVSVGELLRKSMSGAESDQLKSGQLLNDKYVLPLIEQELQKHRGQQFILDGSPRTLSQAKWLIYACQKYELEPLMVIHLIASKSVVKDRLLARNRSDDNEPAIHGRFNEYDNQIGEILDYLTGRKVKIVDIPADEPIEQIQMEISRAISS